MSHIKGSDLRFIKLALQLAYRGIGQTGSNPSVGCVIVKEDKVVGRGATGRNGRPHAETIAILHAGESSVGATLFVTLEPCAHVGETLPCVEAIIKARIARVVCPLIDPDPRVSGTGFKKLKQAKIQVDYIPVARASAENIVRGFISRHAKGRPFVTAKLGMSLDGKIASKTGKSKWITNSISRARSHLLRVQNDSILVGTKTFLLDNPKLNVRGSLNNFSNPLRLFLDRNLKIFPSDQVLKNVLDYPSIVICGEEPNTTNLKIWENANVQVIKIASSNHGIDLGKLLTILGQKGINSLLVEGGGKIIRSLMQNNLIDEYIVHRSGLLIGSDGIPSIAEFKKNSQEISSYPRMGLKSSNRYDDNLETIWKPEKHFT